jgi:hypothetical protein
VSGYEIKLREKRTERRKGKKIRYAEERNRDRREVELVLRSIELGMSFGHDLLKVSKDSGGKADGGQM